MFTSIYQNIPIDLDYRNYEYTCKFAIVVDEVPAQNYLCNLKVNKLSAFSFQYSDSQVKYLQNCRKR